MSDADGRFHFDLDKASSDWPYGDEPAWHEAQIAAVAPGFGPAWVDAGSLLKGGEATLRLVRDDVPIRGRVVDPQGRPIAGVTVRLGRDRARSRHGVDLDAMLASGELDDRQIAASQYDGPTWPGGQGHLDDRRRRPIRGQGRRARPDRRRSSSRAPCWQKATSTRWPGRPRRRRSPDREPSSADRMMDDRPSRPPLRSSARRSSTSPARPSRSSASSGSKATGKPLAGVRVLGVEPATWTEVSARTDAQGRFRLVGLPKGEVYEITRRAQAGDRSLPRRPRSPSPTPRASSRSRRPSSCPRA